MIIIEKMEPMLADIGGIVLNNNSFINSQLNGDTLFFALLLILRPWLWLYQLYPLHENLVVRTGTN